MSRLRILILTPAFRPNLGGVETHLTDLTEHLAKNDYFSYVLTYQPITVSIKGLGVEKKKNLEVHRYSWFSGNYFNIFVNWHPIFNFFYLTPYLAVRSFLFLLTHHSKVDLIHAIGLSVAMPAVVFKRVFKKPVIMTTETLFNFNSKSLFAGVAKWVVENTDILLAQSEQSKKEFVDLGVNPKKIVVFSHWVDLNLFKPTDKSVAKKRLGWENKFTVLYVGRLIPEKGVRLAIGAFEKVANGCQMKIIGSEGPEEEFVKQKAVQNSNIDFLGSKSYRELAKYYQAADVLVYPALYKEDMAYVLLDALSCGTPVINTNPGSGVYALSEDVAFVVKPYEGEIADKIELLMKNSKLAGSMSKQARRFATRFGDRLAKIITDVYDKLVRSA